jgi:deaminated glutathione amidase
MRVAAVQLEAELGNVEHNLSACERLADEAGARGAKLIALPEFFATGVANRPELRDAALPSDGPATELLVRLAARHDALVGGSFLCRDDDGHVRNAFFLSSAEGLIGRHDKDIPTMWENRLYVGGDDPGLIPAGGDLTIGAAVCWELMRTQTAARLRGKADLIVGGSGWWSIPTYPPRPLLRSLERRNSERATRAPARFAEYVGAPVVHAAHAGRLSCPVPGLPLRYEGRFEGAAVVADARGRVLAVRTAEEGDGIAVADVTPGAVTPRRELPEGFWLQRRGLMPSLFWAYQNPLGRWQYRREHRPRQGSQPAA